MCEHAYWILMNFPGNLEGCSDTLFCVYCWTSDLLIISPDLWSNLLHFTPLWHPRLKDCASKARFEDLWHHSAPQPVQMRKESGSDLQCIYTLGCCSVYLFWMFAVVWPLVKIGYSLHNLYQKHELYHLGNHGENATLRSTDVLRGSNLSDISGIGLSSLDQTLFVSIWDFVCLYL